MTIPTTVLAQMATLGLSREQAEAVAEMLSTVEEATRAEGDDSKEKARARWRRWRENHPRTNDEQRLQTLANDSQQLMRGDARVEDKTSNLEIEPQKEERNALTREFDRFWTEYPNKVGKPKALVAFVAARKRASFESILAGLSRYMASKPADRAWLNPATFFNQDRWGDEPATVTPLPRGSPASRSPDLADVFHLIGQRQGDERRTEDFSSDGAVVPYLSVAGQRRQ